MVEIKNSQIVVNDVLEELNEENKRLFNELLFADKCLKVLIEFKSFVELNSNQFKRNLEENNKQLYEELCEKVKQVLDEKNNFQKNFNDNNSIEVKNKEIIINNNKELKISKILILKSPIKVNVKHSNNYNQKLDKSVNYYSKFRQQFSECIESNYSNKRREKRRTNPLFCRYPGCDRKFAYNHELENHKRVHTGETPFECHICGQSYSLKGTLKEHIRIKHNLFDEPVVCGIDDCDKRFNNDRSLKTHRKDYHFNSDKFVCDHPNCDYKTGIKKSLYEHKIREHTTEKPFKCQFEGCDKAFKLEDYYKSHLKCHSKTILNCPRDGCDRTFHNDKTLKCHLRYDHSETSYSCEWPGCEYKNKRKEGIRNHMFTHSNENTVSCIWPDCDKKFKTKANMKNHLLVHKQEKNQICPLPGCDYRCITAGNLKIHMNRHKNILSKV